MLYFVTMIKERKNSAQKALIVVALVLSVFAPVRAQNADYVSEIKQWHNQRIKRLMQPDSWLSLAGLFWLKEGENSFGTDAGNDIRFPDPSPPFIGRFVLDNGEVSVRINKDVQVFHENDPVHKLSLKSDVSGDPTILKYKSLLWYVIDRDGKMGVRLKDTKSENISHFKGIDMFPIDPAWRFKAKLDTTNAPDMLNVPTVLGTISREPCPGALVFRYAGAEYRLYPVGEPGDKSYFLIFADETSGGSTYGAGRFLSIPAVDDHGETIIDFNKAYNPPCAFTPFATCPLPPKGNRLPFQVLAGEKAYAGGH